MAVVWKINGKAVSRQEWDRRSARHKEIFGDKIADIVQSGQSPGVRTNDTWMRGKRCQDPDIDDPSLKYYAERAEAAGVSTSGKFLLESLMDSPDDHRCWVGSDSDALALAKRKKASITIKGVTHDYRDKYRDPAPDKPYEVADHIIEDDLALRLKTCPDATPTEIAKMKADIRREVTPTNIR